MVLKKVEDSSLVQSYDRLLGALILFKTTSSTITKLSRLEESLFDSLVSFVSSTDLRPGRLENSCTTTTKLTQQDQHCDLLQDFQRLE